MQNLISVILPVRNGEDYIFEAVKSILDQNYRYFELIIINDGSTDKTKEIILAFNDSRIIIFDTVGIGLVSALNLGLEKAKGKYIARMDADDIALNNRFSEEIEILEKNNNIGFVCSNVNIINENGELIGKEIQNSTSNNELLEGLTFKKKMLPIIHPTVMFRKELLEKVNGYRHFNSSEDRDLWLRLITITDFYRINKILLNYRITSTGISRTKYNEQKINSMLAVLNYEVVKKLNVDLFEEHPDIIKYFRESYSRKTSAIIKNFEFFVKFKEHNKHKNKAFVIISLLLDKNFISILIYYFYSLRKTRNIIDNSLSITIDLLKKSKNLKIEII